VTPITAVLEYFAVELRKASVDVRKVSRALGHSSVTITERYYAKWNKAQQDILDGGSRSGHGSNDSSSWEN